VRVDRTGTCHFLKVHLRASDECGEVKGEGVKSRGSPWGVMLACGVGQEAKKYA